MFPFEVLGRSIDKASANRHDEGIPVMEWNTTDDTTHVVQRLREALEPGLPYGASLIPLDILIAVAAAHRDGVPLTVKQLTSSLPYSVTGVRYNLDQLIADGWLEKHRAEHDRRLAWILPTERCADAFRLISSVI
jgi:DNA-binding MarR family transcriptional regulator